MNLLVIGIGIGHEKDLFEFCPLLVKDSVLLLFDSFKKKVCRKKKVLNNDRIFMFLVNYSFKFWKYFK